MALTLRYNWTKTGLGRSLSRCTSWVHKTANTLDKLPRKQQAKDMIHKIYLSATRKDAERPARPLPNETKYPRAIEYLSKDREQLFAFYNLTAEHWAHP